MEGAAAAAPVARSVGRSDFGYLHHNRRGPGGGGKGGGAVGREIATKGVLVPRCVAIRQSTPVTPWFLSPFACPKQAQHIEHNQRW